MKEKFYPFRASEDYLFYYFESRSDERTIPKAVQFEKIGADVYNLGFGDLREGYEFNDLVISNNGDMRKVIVDPSLKSHRNDPFVVRKVEEAKRVLKSLKTPIDDIWD